MRFFVVDSSVSLTIKRRSQSNDSANRRAKSKQRLRQRHDASRIRAVGHIVLTPTLELLPFHHCIPGQVHPQTFHQLRHCRLQNRMTGNEVNAWISFVFRFRRVVENDVRSFLQVFLKMRILNLADHDRRRAFQPNHLLQLAASQHAIQNTLHVTDRAGQRHPFADQKIDRQVIEIRMTLPRLYLHLLEWNANELDWLAPPKSSSQSSSL